jgi:hypothetical protein
LADLRTIATPEAAVTLVPFLWNSSLNEEVTYHSAWRLGELLFQSKIIEESLRTYRLTQVQKQPKYLLDWIWKPFSEPSDSALPIIAGRIAYLLNDIINRQNLNEPIAHRFIPNPIPTIDPRLMIPICSILSSNQVNFHGIFFFKAKALLELSELDDDLKEQIHQQVKTVLVEVDRTWGIFILSLPPRFQLDLLYRLIDYGRFLNNYRQDSYKNHWLNIYQEVKFDFKKSWEYRIILSISFLISVVSIYETFYLHSYLIFLITPLVFVIATFLLILLGEYRSNRFYKMEPILWLDLGILGIWIFFGEFITLLRYSDRLNGSNTIGMALGAMSDRAASLGLLILLVAAGLVPGIGAVAGAGIVFVFVAGILGYLSGKWQMSRGKEDPNWRKALFSILFFPWFCWFPLVLCFTSLFLHNRLSWGWGYITLFWVLVIALCSFLWQRGTTLAAKARNPLRGILESTPIVDKG